MICSVLVEDEYSGGHWDIVTDSVPIRMLFVVFYIGIFHTITIPIGLHRASSRFYIQYQSNV